MYFEWFIIVLLSAVVQVYSVRDDPCTTPYGHKGQCTPLPSCFTLLGKIDSNNTSSTRFVQDSLCGWEGIVPLVCCESDLRASRYYADEDRIITLNDFDTNTLPDRSLCGLHSQNETADDRIMGGEETYIGEFPWIVALEYKSVDGGVQVDCGGSLINQRFVLTAAHCVVDGLNAVRLGEHNTTKDPDCPSCDSVVKVGISRRIRHPHYDTRTNNHDIALLEMERDISYTYFIRPICLPPDNMPPVDLREFLTVAGWGTTENASRSDVKLKVDVPILTNEDCASRFADTDDVNLRINQLCAGGGRDKDSCRGDSGGPLMRLYVYNRRQWFQEGIVSRGLGCGRMGRPAIYTRVNRYINWILNIIKLQ